MKDYYHAKIRNVELIEKEFLDVILNYFEVDEKELNEKFKEESDEDVNVIKLYGKEYIQAIDYYTLIDLMFDVNSNFNYKALLTQFSILSYEPYDFMDDEDNGYNGMDICNIDNLYLFFLNPYFRELKYDKYNQCWFFVFDNPIDPDFNSCELYF